MIQKIFKYIQILIGILSGPGIIFILPFILKNNDFSSFAGFLISIQLISLFGSFGLETVGARNLISPRNLLSTYLITHVISLFFTYYFLNENIQICIAAMFCALSSNISISMQNYLLFLGKTKDYAILSSLRAILLIIGLYTAVHFLINIIYSWFALNIFTSAFSILYTKNKINDSKINFKSDNILSLLSIGINMFIINTCSSLPFMLDRIIAKNSLSSEIFAQFMVASTWSIPIIYFGNATQQLLISQNKEISKLQIKRSICTLALKALAFFSIIFLITSFYTPPYFNNQAEFFFFWAPIYCWQTIFCCLMFPLAAHIQRVSDLNILKTLRNYSIIATSVALSAYAILTLIMELKLSLLEIISFSFLFSSTIAISRYLPFLKELKNQDAT